MSSYDERILIPDFLESTDASSGATASVNASDSGSCASCQPYCMDSCQIACQNCQYGGCQGACMTLCESSSQAPTSGGSITSATSTSTSITITYTTISSATSYEVVWRKSSQAELEGRVYGVTGNTYTITGLDGSTEYVVNYKGINSYGEGPFATGVTISTLAKERAYVYSGGWKTATPYIYHNGWKPAAARIYSGGWQ